MSLEKEARRLVRFNLDNNVSIDVTNIGGYNYTEEGVLVVYPKDYIQDPFIYTCAEETRQRFDLFMEAYWNNLKELNK